jgi:hypothetical protein
MLILTLNFVCDRDQSTTVTNLCIFDEILRSAQNDIIKAIAQNDIIKAIAQNDIIKAIAQNDIIKAIAIDTC